MHEDEDSERKLQTNTGQKKRNRRLSGTGLQLIPFSI